MNEIFWHDSVTNLAAAVRALLADSRPPAISAPNAVACVSAGRLAAVREALIVLDNTSDDMLGVPTKSPQAETRTMLPEIARIPAHFSGHAPDCPGDFTDAELQPAPSATIEGGLYPLRQPIETDERRTRLLARMERMKHTDECAKGEYPDAPCDEICCGLDETRALAKSLLSGEEPAPPEHAWCDYRETEWGRELRCVLSAGHTGRHVIRSVREWEECCACGHVRAAHRPDDKACRAVSPGEHDGRRFVPIICTCKQFVAAERAGADHPHREPGEPDYEQMEADSFDVFVDVLTKEAARWKLSPEVQLAISAMLTEPHARLWERIVSLERQADGWMEKWRAASSHGHDNSHGHVSERADHPHEPSPRAVEAAAKAMYELAGPGWDVLVAEAGSEALVEHWRASARAALRAGQAPQEPSEAEQSAFTAGWNAGVLARDKASSIVAVDVPSDASIARRIIEYRALGGRAAARGAGADA